MSRLNNFFCYNPKNEIIRLVYKDSDSISTESINEYKIDKVGIREHQFFNGMQYNNKLVLIHKGYYSTECLIDTRGLAKHYFTTCGYSSGEYFDNSYNEMHPNDGKYDIANLNIIQYKNCAGEYGGGLGTSYLVDGFKFITDCGFHNGANYKSV